MTSCAPSVHDKRLTCYSKSDLETIAKEYNKKYPKNRIIISGKGKGQLWRELRKKLSSQCEQEWCWIDQNFMSRTKAKQIAKEAFRPKMPETWKDDKYTWLATDDINSVMEQYEEEYPSFIFMGAVPIDCETLSFCQLYNFDVVKLYRNGIKKIGVVFNLDYHYQGGSHWVAVFIDLDKHCDVTYYDSYGKTAPQLIRNFMENIINDCQQIKSLRNKIKFNYNKKRHQYGYSECGIYSQNYLIQRLKGKSLKEATEKKIPDKLMNEMRKYLYRNISAPDNNNGNNNKNEKIVKATKTKTDGKTTKASKKSVKVAVVKDDKKEKPKNVLKKKDKKK